MQRTPASAGQRKNGAVAGSPRQRPILLPLSRAVGPLHRRSRRSQRPEDLPDDSYTQANPRHPTYRSVQRGACMTRGARSASDRRRKDPVAAPAGNRMPAVHIRLYMFHVKRHSNRPNLHAEGLGRTEQGYRASGTGGAGVCLDASHLRQDVSREAPADTTSIPVNLQRHCRGSSALLGTTAWENLPEIQSKVTIRHHHSGCADHASSRHEGCQPEGFVTGAAGAKETGRTWC